MAKVLSIQGEKEEARQLDLFATEGEVDAWVREADERYLICRERGRHGFLTISQAAKQTGNRMRFSGVTKEGYLKRTSRCPDCEAVERVELWDVHANKRGQVTRSRMVTSYTWYPKADYLSKPGSGRMRPRDVQGAVATVAMEGSSFRDLLTEAKTNQKAADDARKKAYLTAVS